MGKKDKDEDQEKRDKALSAAYGAATKRLRDDHRDDFNKLYSEEAAARGYEWHPKLSAEQKAEAEMTALLEQFPHLADRFREGERIPEPSQ